MPDLPISEQIVEEVIDRLERITTDNDYQFDLTVERADQLQGSVPDHRKLVLAEGDDVEEEGPQGRMQYRKQFAAAIYLLHPENGHNVDKLLNIIRADIEKELMRDPFFDGLALNVFLRGLRRFEPTSEFYGGAIDFDVQYRVSETDPYNE